MLAGKNILPAVNHDRWLPGAYVGDVDYVIQTLWKLGVSEAV
jgi:hypothetical protein